MLDLTFLRTFLAIYRSGSMTRAADQLHMTQPGVSQHLKALEVQVGRPLFVRHSRGVRPSPAGHELAKRVGPHLDALDAIGESVSARSDGLTGTVYLGGPADLLSTAVMPALGKLVAEGLRVVVRTGPVQALIDMLDRSELDLVVAMDWLRCSDIRYEPLWDDEPVVVASPQWAAALPKDADQRGRAIARGPFVACSDEMPVMRWVLDEVYGMQPSTPPAVIVPDLRAMAAAVAGGAGITVLPRQVVADLIDRGELVELVGDRRPVSVPPKTIYLAYRPASLHTPRVAAIRDLLFEAARGVSEPSSRRVNVG